VADTDLVTLAQAKAFLDITDADASQDAELQQAIEAVTAVIEHEVGPVVRRTVTTTVQPTTSGSFLLPYTDVVSLTSGSTIPDGTALTVSGYTTFDGVLRNPSGSLPTSAWALTYVVGRVATTADVPANIRQAALEAVELAWAAQRGGDPPPFLLSYRVQAMLEPDRQLAGFA